MIFRAYIDDGKKIELIDESKVNLERNVYTIIVGKNGTGKSSLLSTIVRRSLGDFQRRVYRDMELGFESNNWIGEIDGHSNPSQIIAVSASPFDKFPINRRLNEISNYTYLGLRDLMSANFGLAYMTKIMASLIQSVYNRQSQAADISAVLSYLGYKENIHAYFSLNSPRVLLKDLLKGQDLTEFIEKSRSSPVRHFNRRFFYLENDEIDFNKIEYLRNIASHIIDQDGNGTCKLIINSFGIEIYDGSISNLDDILFLVQSGFLRLRDIALELKSNGSKFSIRDASSGEQSVILSILGIASKIQDDSLICIDEPEICLHPEWQEKYIQILIATFSTYRRCHFIIATHSPQIVSRLSPENCFISSIESGRIISADQVINNSIDFQLANIFNSPGFKNEYLSRIALNIFTKVSQKRKFDEDDIAKLELLKSQVSFMDHDDPVVSLVAAINEMFRIYAGN